MILALAILATVVVSAYVLIDAKYAKEAHAHLGKAEEPGSWSLPEPARPAPPLPALRLKDARYAPRKGDTVLVSGVASNGISTHAAIVTRAYTGRLINVMLLPDGAMPLPLLNVELFADMAEASQYLASVSPATPTVAWPHYSTDTGSLK